MINTKRDPLFTSRHYTPSFTADQVSSRCCQHHGRSADTTVTPTQKRRVTTGCTLAERHQL